MTRVKLITYDDLMDKIKLYNNDASELDMIRKAYMLAYEKHFGVKRLTGEDYINHPLNVAYKLTEINADYETISAALLHDIVEDCDVPIYQIEEKFGSVIANLVDGVTKINKLNLATESEAIIANHMKIIVGLATDVRVIIIKLADRIDNMRTMWVMPVKRQQEKAKETLDILVPIAHRLGMFRFKSELEDASLRYYKPDIYFQIVEDLNNTKRERDNSVIEMERQVSELLNKNNIKHEIKGRSKSIYSIYKKLDKGKKFSDIYDLLALRIYVDTEADCYQTLGIIHSKYKPLAKRFKDYIAMPKTNMYQSLHTTIFGVNNALYEIQIRTYKMDEIAENGIASHFSFKEKGSNVRANMQSDMEQKLQFFKSIIELREENVEDDVFVKTVTEEIFKNTIYVYTPNGDVIELPKGANPIDFAYKVHTKVGDNMIGAIVNGTIVPLDHELNNGDIIKINTNKNSDGPSREWLTMAKTSQARTKIKAFFNKIDKDSYIKEGENLLKDELRKKKIPSKEFFIDENIAKILKEYNYTTIEEVYNNIGNLKITPSQIIKIICSENETKEDLILKKAKNKKIDTITAKTDIIVSDIDDILVNIAACCKPVPGDNIVGYITKGDGISVHRATCPNIKDIKERIIDVSWRDGTNSKYNTSILIHALESDKILMDIVSKATNVNANILSINTSRANGNVIYEIGVSVEDKEILEKFIDNLNSLENILDVERVIR